MAAGCPDFLCIILKALGAADSEKCLTCIRSHVRISRRLNGYNFRFLILKIV